MPLLSLLRLSARLAAAAVLTVAFASVAMAADPIGKWLVANGHAQVKIAPCGDAYWGVIDWTSRAGDVDKENPDPAKRNRPVLGMAILLAMKPSAPNEWSGEVYNAENGKTYEARISLIEPDVLKITGCILGGLFCGGENWTRVKDDAAGSSQQSGKMAPMAKGAKSQAAAPTPLQAPRAPAKKGTAPAPGSKPEVCPS